MFEHVYKVDVHIGMHVKELKKDIIIIYPNPSSQIINVMVF